MNRPCLGIDIAKVKFNVCLLQLTGKLKHKVFPNTVAGFGLLLAWLAKQQVSQGHACLEATGTYGEALSHYLYDRGYTVSVMNPAAINARGGSGDVAIFETDTAILDYAAPTGWLRL